MHEAKIEETETGLQPADDGWWILNASDIGWFAVEGSGIWSSFESPRRRSPLLGIGIHILRPGETPGMYHAESNQEGFLVLSGECLAIVEGEERPMRQWDYLHCPPGTAHITIGAGDGPCAILMVGGRRNKGVLYPVVDVALKHKAGVETETRDGKEAYAPFPEWTNRPYRDGDLP